LQSLLKITFIICFIGLYSHIYSQLIKTTKSINTISMDSSSNVIRHNKLSVVILTPYDEFALAGASPNVSEMIEKKIQKDSTFKIIQYSYKKIQNFYMIFDKKYCSEIIKKLNPNIIIMSKIQYKTKKFSEEDLNRNIEIKAYLPKQDVYLSIYSEKNISNIKDIENDIFNKINLSLLKKPFIKDILTTKKINPIVKLDCSSFKFNDLKQQADTLLKYTNKNELITDEKFFCAFPNSFLEMQNIFGFSPDIGAAILYDYPNGEKVIEYFAKLNSISKEIYYNKYINICIDGVWEADNIVEAFGFADRLKNDTKAACIALSKRSNKEIKSVFHFIFDGPHPNNTHNEKIYNELLIILLKQNTKLAKLLKESYNKVMPEDDGHGQ
jgi:hypothetical protein